MNRAWVVAGYQPPGWPCGGGGGSDPDAVKRSDFDGVDQLPVPASADDTAAKLREVVAAVKGACVALMLAPLALFASTVAPEDLSPTNTIGEASPLTTVGQLVGTGETDPKFAEYTNGNSSVHNGVVLASYDGDEYSLFPDPAVYYYQSPFGGFFGTGGRFNGNMDYDGYLTLNQMGPFVPGTFTVDPMVGTFAHRFAYDSAGDFNTSVYDGSQWFYAVRPIAGVTRDDYATVEGFPYDSQLSYITEPAVISLDYIGDGYHRLHADGTVETLSDANALSAAPWAVVRNGVTQDVSTVGSPFFDDGKWDVSEVSEECSEVPPFKGHERQNAVRWNVGTNRWLAVRPPVPQRVVSRSRLVTETAVTNTVSNVVESVKDLHYDKTLGVTWRQVVDNGFIHYIAVTNSDVTVP